MQEPQLSAEKRVFFKPRAWSAGPALAALTLCPLSCRLAKAPPRRALSVEDVGAPSLARTVGRVVEVFPDGTSQLQLQRSPEGTFGFCVASGNGRRDSGMLPLLSGPRSPGTLANRTGGRRRFFLAFG